MGHCVSDCEYICIHWGHWLWIAMCYSYLYSLGTHVAFTLCCLFQVSTFSLRRLYWVQRRAWSQGRSFWSCLLVWWSPSGHLWPPSSPWPALRYRRWGERGRISPSETVPSRCWGCGHQGKTPRMVSCARDSKPSHCSNMGNEYSNLSFFHCFLSHAHLFIVFSC